MMTEAFAQTPRRYDPMCRLCRSPALLTKYKDAVSGVTNEILSSAVNYLLGTYFVLIELYISVYIRR